MPSSTPMESIDLLTELFKGRHNAYGVFFDPKDPDHRGKVKGEMRVIHKEVSLKVWRDHVEGRRALAIIPITVDSTCWFSCIDIDVYQNFKHEDLAKKFEEAKIPAFVCRSKSGGAHIYFFYAEPIPGNVVVPMMRRIASWLGRADAEVFPANMQVAPGDVGVVLNMPYFGGHKGTRVCITSEGNFMSLPTFIERAYRARMKREELQSITLPIPESLPGAPPCIQKLVANKVSEGGRDNFLFSLGVYLQKAHGDMAVVRERLKVLNQDVCQPPLDDESVERILNSLVKKDYFYRCKTQPLLSVCDKDVCRTCTHGITAPPAELIASTLVKYDSYPAIWFLTLDNGSRVRLETEDLMNFTRFATCCVEQCNTVPNRPKDWMGFISSLMATVKMQEAPPEARREHGIRMVMEKWFNSMGVMRKVASALYGNPALVEGRRLFSFTGIKSELRRNNMRNYDDAELTQILLSLGCTTVDVVDEATHPPTICHLWEFVDTSVDPDDRTEMDPDAPPLPY